MNLTAPLSEKLASQGLYTLQLFMESIKWVPRTQIFIVDCYPRARQGNKGTTYIHSKATQSYFLSGLWCRSVLYSCKQTDIVFMQFLRSSFSCLDAQASTIGFLVPRPHTLWCIVLFVCHLLVQTKKKSKTLVTWSFSSDLQDQKHFVWSNIEINVVRKQNKDYTVVSHTLLILAGLNFWWQDIL